MKSKLKLAVVLTLALSVLAPATLAQKKKKDAGQTPATTKTEAGERLEGDDTSVARPDVPENALANRRERMNEDAEAEIPSYNNFLAKYLLGPEDVISITVFGLDRYSKSGIVIPPDGRVDYYHIRDGVHVVGKTRQQVADEITAHLEEYIREPKVTVTLEKAMSMRYGVLGDVGKPGVYNMSRRLSVYEAVMEAGGVLSTGDKKRVVVLHWNADRTLQQIPINLSAIEKGKAPDNYFLGPGDQVVVPGNRFKTVQKVLGLLPVLSFARIFTGGF